MKEADNGADRNLLKLKCKICGNETGNELVIATEKMFGLGDRFDYFVCAECKCLQIKEIPENIEKYYPQDYYSYQEAVFPSELNRFNYFLKKSLIKYYMGYFNLTGFLLSYVFEHPFYWIRKRELSFESKILDIGSGAGRKLLSLRRSGFLNLTGTDPYINRDIFYENGVKILKKEIDDIEGTYDFIMLHHSFEHMEDPKHIITQLSRLMKPDGVALIRIPVADSFAWHKFQTYWFGLDAPRHFFLHTPRSMAILMQGTDLKIDEIIFDSTALQFTGSIKYMKNLLFDSPDDMFTKKEIRAYTREAKKLNRTGQGDWACFYLKKAH